MPDSISGSSPLRFSNADNSANTAKSSDEKNSREDYYYLEKSEEEEEQDGFKKSQFVDRSAQLNASLDSLAMMNVANVLKNNKSSKFFKK